MLEHTLNASASPLPFAGVLAMADVTDPAIQKLKDRSLDLQVEGEEIVAHADAAKRDLSQDETKRLNEISAEMQDLQEQVQAREGVLAGRTSAGRRTTPDPTAAPGRDGNNRTVPAQPRAVNPRGGFASFGEFAKSVKHGSMRGNQPEPRLVNATTTFGGEGVGADGGFPIPPDFATRIYEKVQAEENLLDRCTQLQTASNSIVIPKDEVTPWDTSNGIQVYWEKEAGQVSPTKPHFELDTVRLNKLMALVPISEEALEDSVLLESWLAAKAPAKMASKINTAIVSGTGGGEPLGILESPSMITVAEEGSQTSGSIWFANINKMWARMYAPWRRNSIWLINQDAEPQLDAMAFDPNATTKIPVYLPPLGLSAEGYNTLKGRPVVPVEACSTVGVNGDIILVDFNQYWAITKAQGIRTDMSMHLYFDQDLMAFRFTFRMNGMPAWSKALTRENGSNTLSWAVSLAARP